MKSLDHFIDVFNTLYYQLGPVSKAATEAIGLIHREAVHELNTLPNGELLAEKEALIAELEEALLIQQEAIDKAIEAIDDTDLSTCAYWEHKVSTGAIMASTALDKMQRERDQFLARIRGMLEQ